MDTVQGGVLVYKLDQTKVFMSDHASPTARVIPSDHSVHADHNFPLDRADQTVRTDPSDHPITPTVPHVLSIVLTQGRPYWSLVSNHDLEMDFIDPLNFFPSQFNILRLIVKPDSTWNEKNPKMFTYFLLWPFWCVMRVPKAVLTSLLQCPTH
ncbi:hypothetical protein Bca101_074853 [Brassica carinata]